MNLSKSKYTRGVQCPKMLWMEAHMADQFDESVMNQAVLTTGNMVGDMAMGYFGDFVEVEFRDHGKNQMVEQTQQLVRAALKGEGPVNIAEATFAYEGNLCMVDILRVEDDGMHLVEVKSSTHLNPIYYHDMAFQTWVLTKCGMNVKSISLMHLNSGYVRQGDLDLKSLFKVNDCTEEVRAMLPKVEERIRDLGECVAQEQEPGIPFGCQCGTPYPCGYKGWCWREVPTPSVFDLSRIGAAKALNLYQEGIVTYEDVVRANDKAKAEAEAEAAAKGRKGAKPKAKDKVKLSPRQRVQMDCALLGLDSLVDKAAVAKYLQELTFPLYFLDFETYQPAVPPFDGVRPFQQIPTQYSLHVVAEPGAEPQHYEFLAEPGADPRRAVAEHLVEHIPAGVCTLAYNMSFEKGRIAEMAQLFPDLADRLLAISEGMADLITPFARGWYYAAGMGGSNSIKYVLPALFPDDPDLNYAALEGVRNGSEAMAAFADLESMDPEEAARVRSQLLKYCELDTLAMVKIWQKLTDSVS